MPESTERDWISLVLDATGETWDSDRGQALGHVLRLAVELAHEGREGQKVGSLFVVGDHEAVLERSHALLLDPLHGHASELRHAARSELRETVKELALIDGAFIVDDRGTFVAAGRFLDVDFAAAKALPLGLGSRHAAAASVSRTTGAVVVALSESSVVRVFVRGEVRAEISLKLFLGHAEGSFAIDAPAVHELPMVGLTVAVATQRATSFE